ncbi:ras and EF-hand domain-containing protein isoform X1 [Syngnathus typhle]|uniref:ras and EF-hand domain-containing protein isoform X1 n=1 Tax=Syngnathus typhle TaxID=161592 RepID=UPI002A6A1A84|nr:ras and EF-hand domain-containing protein isoform X1 [Syngnathus typhle]
MATASARALSERRRSSLFQSRNELDYEKLTRKDSSTSTDIGGDSGTFQDQEDGLDNVGLKETVKASVPRPKVMSAEERERLRALFDTYDTDGSGSIERDEFFTICTELQVSPSEAERLFNRLDVDKDGTITLPEFISGFHERHRMDVAQEPRQEEDDDEPCEVAWEDFEARLGEQSKFIPKHDLVATLYQNISVNEPRLIPQLEKVLQSFVKEIKQQNAEMENLALAIRRAQDQASMQLSEMEEEMDQRIHITERKTREQEKKRGEKELNELRRTYEMEVCELQCKIQRMQMIEEKYKNITVKDESQALKKKINELTLENQRIKQELLKSQTKVACLQSDMDSLKTELTDQSINYERDEELMKQFSEEREILESQIEILQEANRKLHDSNDGLRTALERTTKSSMSGSSSATKDRNRSKSFAYPSPHALERLCQRVDDFTIYSRRPSTDSLALALCDPGLKRRNSSECEEDSLPEIYMDSGLSTLRGSHGGYDSEQEVKGLEEEEAEEEEESVTKKTEMFVAKNLIEEIELAETQDGESAFGSDTSSVLDWKPSEAVRTPSEPVQTPSEPVRIPANPATPTATHTRKAISAINVQREEKEGGHLGYMTSEKAYRIVMAGDAAVGKSSFLLRLCKNEFKFNSNATLGVDFQMKTFMVDGEPTLLQIWDTAGQERFRSIAKSYFRRADGVLLLYDVTCEKSFLNVREWVDMIEDMGQEDVPIMLVGNKCDLRQGAANCVPTSYGEKLAMQTYNTLFCETSAKDGSNILEAVLHLARQVTKHSKLDETGFRQSLPKLDAPRKKPNFSCCN